MAIQGKAMARGDHTKENIMGPLGFVIAITILVVALLVYVFVIMFEDIGEVSLYDDYDEKLERLNRQLCNKEHSNRCWENPTYYDTRLRIRQTNNFKAKYGKSRIQH